MNSPIQGTAADIMKIAMVRTYRGLLKAGLQSRLVLQIHDELVVETEQSELDEVKAIVADAMSHAASLKVELAIDMNVGKDWYESK
jgi:DNA polymerase-1